MCTGFKRFGSHRTARISTAPALWDLPALASRVHSANCAACRWSADLASTSISHALSAKPRRVPGCTANVGCVATSRYDKRMWKQDIKGSRAYIKATEKIKIVRAHRPVAPIISCVSCVLPSTLIYKSSGDCC